MGVTQATTSSPAARKETVLNPRLLANDPVGFHRRYLYLKLLHAEFVRLNHLVSTCNLKHKHLLQLDDQELIRKTLDEEERVARDRPQVYMNVIKSVLSAYKKMTLHTWIEQIAASFVGRKSERESSKTKSKHSETGLTPTEEAAVLKRLVVDQSKLTKHGYIPTPPTGEQAKEAAASVEYSKNYEVCERCSARFRVFPDRNEEGDLTSNGPCRHHPMRVFRPVKQSGDTGHRDPYYPCCNEAVGSLGCTESTSHVFKANSPGRLAAILPFINTPERKATEAGSAAVCFDCEMCYTTFGLELVRLTAVDWPSGKKLVDVLVRPLGIIIDLNSRFSGVFPEHFDRAYPYGQNPDPPLDPSKDEPDASRLPCVENPQAARALLCKYLTPDTPLLGHGLENDLNAVRLCHPTIVDTIVCFPHPRGLPFRYGLKMLTKTHLDREIQNAGAAGHDSMEDARATGDLVRFKVGQEWKKLSNTGWKLENGQLIAPAGFHENNKKRKKEAISEDNGVAKYLA